MIYFEWFNINVGAPPPLGFTRVAQTSGLIGLNKDFIFWQSGFLFSSTKLIFSANNLISMSRSISLINPYQSFHGLISQIIKQHASAVLILASWKYKLFPCILEYDDVIHSEWPSLNNRNLSNYPHYPNAKYRQFPRTI